MFASFISLEGRLFTFCMEAVDLAAVALQNWA